LEDDYVEEKFDE
jgi:hypothetical protein